MSQQKNNSEEKRTEMSLERFRELRKETADLVEFDLKNKLSTRIIQSFLKTIQKQKDPDYELTEEDILEAEKVDQLFNEFEERQKRMSDEIDCSTLMKIPFNEYEGFYDIGFDFEGTYANLDFKLLKTRGFYFDETNLPTCRYKTCKVKNLRSFRALTMRTNKDSFDKKVFDKYPSLFATCSRLNQNKINQSISPEEKESIIDNLQQYSNKKDEKEIEDKEQEKE